MGADTATHRSYPFRGIEQYDRLKLNKGGAHRILVVFFLPDNSDEWLKISPNELLLKYAAYWVCLYGDEATETITGKTIYLPKENLLLPVT